MAASESMLAFFGPIGAPEMIIFGIIAVLLFGSRLPTVARSLGKSIVEFKKGMHDLQDEVRSSVDSEAKARVGYRPPREESEPSAPKFEPPKTDDANQDSKAEEQLVR
jgi:sec-independent protein translocase protein TatA